MRLTRAAPAGTTSSITPPISRTVAPLMGANKASYALERDAFRTAALRAGFRAGFFAALRAGAFFAFFAMATFYHGARICANMIRILTLTALTLITATGLPAAQQESVVGTWKLVSYDTRTA